MRQPPIESTPTAGLPAYCPAPPRGQPMPAPITPQAKPHGRHNARGEKVVTVAQLFDGNSTRPMIRLRGHWLQRLGFKTGERIAVTQERGRIVLTLECAE